MPKYLSIQEAPITDSITDDGHVGARHPWPVVADEEGTVVTPSSILGMVRILGFQNDLAVNHVDLWWADAYADPDKAVGKYLVAIYTNGSVAVNMSAVGSVGYLETSDPLPVER